MASPAAPMMATAAVVLMPSRSSAAITTMARSSA